MSLPILKITHKSKDKHPEKIAKLFQGIANRENGIFKIVKERFLTKYIISFHYNEVDIIVQYNLGLQEVGMVSCQFNCEIDDLEFKVDERRYIARLMSKYSEILYLKSNNDKFQSLMEQSRVFHNLNRLAKEDSFQPFVVGKETEGQIHIRTEYHLDFINRRQVVEPLIEFYKYLIDNLKK